MGHGGDGRASLLSLWFVSEVSALRGGCALGVTSDAGQDLIRRFCPHEGFGVFVVHVGVLTNGRFQLAYAAEYAPSNSLVGEFGKPALHQVDPGSIGGSEVDMKAWTFSKPFRMRAVLWVP